MKPMAFCLGLVFWLVMYSLIGVAPVHAGGAVAKRQEGQQKMMQQKQQQQMQQRALMEQRVQYERAQQNALQKKAIERQQETILDKQEYEGQLKMRVQQQREQRQQRVEDEVKDVVDINELIASFEVSSDAWPLIIDAEAKAVVISAYIDQYRQQGTTINKSSFYYADLIDGMVQQAPDMLSQPLKNVLRVLAVIEYDFNNGQDKDEMALKVLGNRSAVEQNKQRLGL
jgi:hypothetical protein